MSYREEKELLEKFGCENIKYENYSSNYCIIFNYNNKRIDLGSYAMFENAVKVRKEAEDKYFGEYSYDNSISS